MKVQKGFQYRLIPTKAQEQSLLQHGGNSRFLWNLLLADNIDYYKITKKFRFYHEMAVSLPKLKQEYTFLKESFSQSLQMVARQLDKSLRDSFKKTKVKGFPSFKKKLMLNDSFTCPQAWRLGRGFIFIPKIGEVKWKKHRALQGKPKSITISQDGDKWYCSVLCEYEIKEQEKRDSNIVGCDVGLKEFVTLSDGTVFPNPRHLKKYKEKLTKEQRKLSKKQKGSRNRLKQRLKVRNVHAKIKNVRQDFLHNTSNSIAKNYDGVMLENLNVKGMMKNHKLAKSISDVSWSEFRRQLEYKCRWYFKHCIVIGRFEPTSKRCSKCGHIQDMPLEKRKFDCEECDLELDRDLNAAINIRNIGINTLGRRGVNACGDEGLPSSMKQEKECLVN